MQEPCSGDVARPFCPSPFYGPCTSACTLIIANRRGCFIFRAARHADFCAACFSLALRLPTWWFTKFVPSVVSRSLRNGRREAMRGRLDSASWLFRRCLWQDRRGLDRYSFSLSGCGSGRRGEEAERTECRGNSHSHCRKFAADRLMLRI